MSKIAIVYFAWVRERIGRGEETLEYPENIQTISDLLDYLIKQNSIYQSAFGDLNKLRFALDQDFVTVGTLIGQAKELAIFPPVTGG